MTGTEGLPCSSPVKLQACQLYHCICPFCAAIKYSRLGNYKEQISYMSEAEKSKVKGHASGEGCWVVSSHGRRRKGRRDEGK